MAHAQHSPDRSAVPSEAVQQQSLDLIKEVYGEEWEAAKSSAQRQSLATKLLNKAQESSDAANRYVLYKLARDIAAQSGDADLAFKAIDAMAARYEVDAYKLKGAALSQAAKSAVLQKHRSTIAKLSLELIDQAVEKDDFIAATYLGGLAIDVARKAREYALVKQIVARNEEVEDVAKAFADIQGALAKLKDDPVAPDANLAVGKYHCLLKGDWDRGLPMLVLSSDKELKKLAVKELGDVSATDEQVALGDGWWDLTLASEGVAKKQLERRAAYWYRKALPGLTGLVKDKTANRLSDLAAEPVDREELLAERKAARLVLSFGGRVFIYGSNDPVTRSEDVPKGPFHIKVIEIETANHFTDAHLIALKKLSRLQILRVCSPDKAEITDRALACLSELPRLKGLMLINTKITDRGLQHLADYPELSGFDLRGADITDEGLRHIKRIDSLSWICLCHAKITDNGLANIAHLTDLRHISLSGAKNISDRGIEYLLPLPNVIRLNIDGTKVTRHGIERFRQRHPECNIER